MDSVRLTSSSLKPTGQNQIGILMIEDAFVTLLKSFESQVLILHDELAFECNSSLSTLSYLCALITEMMSSPGVFPLRFFCGLHCREVDALQAGYGIMRSLALDLLRLFGNANIATTGDPNMTAQGLMMNHLPTIFSIFSRLLLQNIPAGELSISWWMAHDGWFLNT